jgi:hypothetical protein
VPAGGIVRENPCRVLDHDEIAVRWEPVKIAEAIGQRRSASNIFVPSSRATTIRPLAGKTSSTFTRAPRDETVRLSAEASHQLLTGLCR